MSPKSQKGRSGRGGFEGMVTGIGLAALVIFSIFPLVWMVLTSFKTVRDTFTLPPVLVSNPPAISNWQSFFQPNTLWGGPDVLTRFLPNSLIASTGTTALVLLIGLFAAHSLARYNFRGRATAAFLIISTRMLPPIVTVLPLFIFFSGLRLIDTMYALLLSYTAFTLPFAIWLLAGFIKEIPLELEEAAMVDGAGRLEAMFRITLPLSAPGIAVTSLFTFLWVWNDFQVAYFLVDFNAKTLPLVAASFSTDIGTYFGPMSAFGVITIIPAVIFAVIAQKYLVRGLTMGAVKG